MITQCIQDVPFPRRAFKIDCGNLQEVREWLDKNGCKWINGRVLTKHLVGERYLVVNKKHVEAYSTSDSQEFYDCEVSYFDLLAEAQNQVNTEPKTAEQFLQKAADLMAQRGKEYENEQKQERSAGKIAVAFNAVTGKDLTEAEVWLLLQLLKDVRQWSNPAFHRDSAEDCVAYAALKAEALASDGV